MMFYLSYDQFYHNRCRLRLRIIFCLVSMSPDHMYNTLWTCFWHLQLSTAHWVISELLEWFLRLLVRLLEPLIHHLCSVLTDHNYCDLWCYIFTFLLYFVTFVTLPLAKKKRKEKIKIKIKINSIYLSRL